MNIYIDMNILSENKLLLKFDPESLGNAKIFKKKKKDKDKIKSLQTYW